MNGDRERMLAGILIVSVVVVIGFVYYMTKDTEDMRFPVVRDLTVTNTGYPGSNTYDATCENGAFVTRLGAVAGPGINQLFMTCSDKQVYGPFGTNEGGLSKDTIISDKGFSRGNIWYEDKIKGINAFDGDIYKSVGSPYGTQEVQDCGDGKIVGITGDGDGFVNNLGFKCGYSY